MRAAASRRLLGIGSAVLLVIMGASVAFGLRSMSHVASSGLCFSGPLSGAASWPYSSASNRLKLAYYLPPAKTSLVAAYDSAAGEAFLSWEAAWPILHFQRVTAASRAQISIEFDNYGRSGQWTDHAGLTVPDYAMFGCGLTHATIEINSSYLTSNGSLVYPATMLRHLFVHEIGHALGLRHVFSPIKSVMVPTSNAYIYVRPQKYDIATIAQLYPAAQQAHLAAPSVVTRTGAESAQGRTSTSFAGKP